MATAYTHVLVDMPDTTFEQFAMRCARAFSAYMRHRDTPLDAEVNDTVVVDEYYRKEMEESEAYVRELANMSLEEAQRRADQDNDKRLADMALYRAKLTKENAVYQAMLEKVEAWQPPTADHQALKRFMNDQLRSSMYDPVVALRIPTGATKPLSGEEWLTRERKRANEELVYDTKKWQEEQTLAVERTQWIKDLKASLK